MSGVWGGTTAGKGQSQGRAWAHLGNGQLISCASLILEPLHRGPKRCLQLDPKGGLVSIRGIGKGHHEKKVDSVNPVMDVAQDGVD